jgi:hypothetical protein
MTDRELLEAAAKAAGIGGGWDWPRGAKYPAFWRDGSGKAWQPLNDDGDALRLAVKLRIVIEQGDGWSDAGGWCTVYHSDHKDDPYAATRRAIVRAAAEIGRETK